MTYRILLVDDEVHAIEGVKSDLNLVKLNIEEVFTAYNIRQAKEVFEKEQIDILLCDIEMPQGSGLELLSWVREHHPNTVTIFLTSHADFKYAKEAMKLGSLEYLLKPVIEEDLENAIQKAQNVIDLNSEHRRNSQSHQLWMKHHSLIIERFWLDLINHTIPSRPLAIREHVERHHIPITEESIFLPILISVQRWNKVLKSRDETILEYALKNSSEEMIIGNHGNGISFQLDRGMFLVILVGNSKDSMNQEQVLQACNRYVQSCHRLFYCDLSCYVGELVEVQGMEEMVATLKTRERNNVAFVNQVFTYYPAMNTELPSKLPAMSGVASLLKTGNREAVISELEKFLEGFKQDMDAGILHQCNQDFVQVLYSFLNAKGIQAHQLFGDDESRHIAEAAGRSVTDMLAWVRHAVNKAVNQAEAVNETDTVVQTIKQYIALNLDQDISREQIAEQVFLNPDYLSRIFKKETGYSFTDYVLTERIRLAKELLSQTTIPISSVASSVGITNFSYFAKIFKKFVGIGPTEYRSMSRDEINTVSEP